MKFFLAGGDVPDLHNAVEVLTVRLRVGIPVDVLPPGGEGLAVGAERDEGLVIRHRGNRCDLLVPFDFNDVHRAVFNIHAPQGEVLPIRRQGDAALGIVHA